ncbi:hypothetical protein C8R44DRAFT_894695 [Mycena epipterygia]|nr:hypothetical protein C8R44DRAFT_894695 [Mycena epipterygia]
MHLICAGPSGSHALHVHRHLHFSLSRALHLQDWQLLIYAHIRSGTTFITDPGIVTHCIHALSLHLQSGSFMAACRTWLIQDNYLPRHSGLLSVYLTLFSLKFAFFYLACCTYVSLCSAYLCSSSY